MVAALSKVQMEVYLEKFEGELKLNSINQPFDQTHYGRGKSNSESNHSIFLSIEWHGGQGAELSANFLF